MFQILLWHLLLQWGRSKNKWRYQHKFPPELFQHNCQDILVSDRDVSDLSIFHSVYKFMKMHHLFRVNKKFNLNGIKILSGCII